jgi:tellurite resistance protein
MKGFLTPRSDAAILRAHFRLRADQTNTTFRSERALRGELRRAARDARRAACAVRHADGLADAVTSAALQARLQLAVSRCETLARVARDRYEVR